MKRTYDIRIRNAIATSRNPNLFPELNIPRSTALQWIREGYKIVVTHPGAPFQDFLEYSERIF